jgi:cytidylate kinase
MKKINIAIDGFAGCGKSTTAKLVAEKLHYIYTDTGAMYRAVTLYLLTNKIDITNVKGVISVLPYIHLSFERNSEKKLEIYLNGESVELLIRSMEVSDRVSEVSAIPEVRRFLVEQQKKIAQKRGVVMDGRDIGTVVMPNAELKFFMSANINVRAKRRQQELLSKGQSATIEEIILNMEKRDQIDTSRTEGPLKKADDAIEIDTSDMSIEQQVQIILDLVEERVFNIA